MRTLSYLLPAVACPVGMGVMMWVMMRRPGQQPTPIAQDRHDEELVRLRQELDDLQRKQSAPH
jgi:hypothetical protein